MPRHFVTISGVDGNRSEEFGLFPFHGHLSKEQTADSRQQAAAAAAVLLLRI